MAYSRKQPHWHLRSCSRQTKERVLRAQKHQVHHPNTQIATQVQKEKHVSYLQGK